jgi:hypothetical protein
LKHNTVTSEPCRLSSKKDATVSGRPLRVLHSHPTWLPQTQPRLYNLVRHLPETTVESHVVVERTENLEQFSIPRPHGLNDGSPWDRSVLM